MSNAALDKATAKTREANQSYDRLYDPNPKVMAIANVFGNGLADHSTLLSSSDLET